MRFHKPVPGADAYFMPEDIGDYAGDPWDIRITHGDAPIDEGFYLTVPDPGATRLSISEALQQYALDPARADTLEVSEYPELPFLQQELIQLWSGAMEGRLNLEVYVNGDPAEGQVDLARRVDEVLSTNVYRDGSHDYRLLDLVWIADIAPPSESEIADFERRYDPVFLLALFCYHLDREEAGGPPFDLLLRHPLLSRFARREPLDEHPRIERALGELERQGLLEVDTVSKRGLLGSKDQAMLLPSEEGLREIERLRLESEQVERDYDRFASVSIDPPALGVPQGFDVRVQLMQADGRDAGRAVMLRVLEQDKDDYFHEGQWVEMLEASEYLADVYGALAYTTSFSPDVLARVRAL